MAISATSLFSSGSTASSTRSATQSRAAAAAQVAKNREYAAISSLQQLGKTLAKAKFETNSVAGVVSYEDNYVSVPTYKRVVTYRTQSKYEDQPIYEDRDVVGKKTIFKTVDVHATRPTYEQHDVLGTVVNGNKSANGLDDLAAAGIDENADFSVKVGNDDAATIKFGANNQISLTVGSTVSNFDYDGSAGSLSGAVLSALNSVSGLAASYDAQGQLKLETADEQSLTIADVDNDPLDPSGSPLAALGLSAGTTQASVIGTEQVQTGTEDYVSGTKKVATGTRNVVTGTEKVQIGTQKVSVGTEQVVDQVRYDKTGETRKSAGQIRVQEDRTTETTLSQASHKAILTAALNLDSAIGPAQLSNGAANPMAGIRGYVNVDKLKTSLNQTDIGLATLGVQQVLKAYQKAKAASSSSGTTA